MFSWKNCPCGYFLAFLLHAGHFSASGLEKAHWIKRRVGTQGPRVSLPYQRAQSLSASSATYETHDQNEK